MIHDDQPRHRGPSPAVLLLIAFAALLVWMQTDDRAQSEHDRLCMAAVARGAPDAAECKPADAGDE